MTISQRAPLLPLKRLSAIRSSNVDKVVEDNEIPIRLCNYVDVYYNDQIHPALEFAAGSAKQSEIDRFGLRPGDVLITKDSETPDDIAVPALVVQDADDLVCGYHLALLRPNPSRLNGTFLFYALKSRSLQAAFSVLAQGITRFGLTLNGIGSVPVPLPDLLTQKAIAEFLDRETARIDRLIEKKQRFSSLANERWVSELNDSVFPTFPNWSHLPAEWEKVRLKYLTDPMRPIMYGIVLPGLNVEFGKLIVKGGDVKPGRLDPELLCKTTIEIESTYVRSRVKAGDLIISIRGGIGDLEVVPKTIEGANLTQDAARIAPRSGIDVEWLRYALSAPVVFHLLEAKSLGAAVRGINIFDLKRVFVPTPPSEIQTRIRDSLVAAERRLARLKELVVQHTEKIQEFRSALITAAVTGQIDVSTWSKKGMTERRFDQIEEATSA